MDSIWSSEQNVNGLEFVSEVDEHCGPQLLTAYSFDKAVNGCNELGNGRKREIERGGTKNVLFHCSSQPSTITLDMGAC